MVGIGIGIGFKLAAVIKTLLAAGMVVAVVSVLTWERLKMWFNSRKSICTADADNIAFSLVEKIKDNEYKTVYGIFNKRTDNLVEVEAVRSESLDETLHGFHKLEPLVLYR